ncbi:MAG: hypothetical protein ACREUY_01070 [Burkholderiales bacterium]
MANNNRAISIQSPDDLSKYRVNRPGQLEVLRQSLYDFQVYAQAGQTSLVFFQVPISGTKTEADTNMVLAGQLPAGQQFLAQSLEVYFFPGTVLPGTGPVANVIDAFINDVWAVYKGGWVKFKIGSKDYLQEAPIGRMPPKTRLDGWSSENGNTTAAAALYTRTSYASPAGRPYPIDPYVLLESTQNFVVALNWPVAVAVTNAGRIGVILDGLLIRNSQ